MSRGNRKDLMIETELILISAAVIIEYLWFSSQSPAPVHETQSPTPLPSGISKSNPDQPKPVNTSPATRHESLIFPLVFLEKFSVNCETPVLLQLPVCLACDYQMLIIFGRLLATCGL